MKRKVRFVVTAAIAALTMQSIYAAVCAIDPTKGAGGMAATERFGAYRQKYNKNTGGGHQGVDLRSANGTPLYSPFAGKVLIKNEKPGDAGNYIVIKNDAGDSVWLMHLSGFAKGIVEDGVVTAGQFIALSGNTGAGTGPHLHLEYTVMKSDDVRNKIVKHALSQQDVLGLKTVFKQKSTSSYTTDPAGYMCDAYTFVKGAAEDNATLGKNTKEQYAILYGNVPNGVAPDTKYTDSQTIAANSVAVQANAKGKSVTDYLSTQDGYGVLPGVRYEKYEETSPSEMLSRESKRRMIDIEWQKNLTLVSSRALWVDYLQTIAISNYMQEAIYRKREKAEALLATLVAQEASHKQLLVDVARDTAVRQSSTNSLK